MEVTIKIDNRNKQAKSLLEMLKTFDFVKFVDREVQEQSSTLDAVSDPVTDSHSSKKEQLVEELSKKVNRATAKKWYKRSEIAY